jgi:hypothetical protein
MSQLKQLSLKILLRDGGASVTSQYRHLDAQQSRIPAKCLGNILKTGINFPSEGYLKGCVNYPSPLHLRLDSGSHQEGAAAHQTYIIKIYFGLTFL